MSEHHHSLKRETSHETNPLLYQMLTKPTLDEPSIALKGRAGRQGREERGRGRDGGRGGSPKFGEKRGKMRKFWQEISAEPREAPTCSDGNFNRTLILNTSVTRRLKNAANVLFFLEMFNIFSSECVLQANIPFQLHPWRAFISGWHVQWLSWEACNGIDRYGFFFRRRRGCFHSKRSLCKYSMFY